MATAVPALDGDREHLGTGIEGKQIQAMAFTQPVIIEGPDNRCMPLFRFLAGAAFALAALPLLGQGLPPEVDAALAKARFPRDAISIVVVDAEGKGAARLSHRAEVPVNPASIAKLATTFAAMDLLGPAFSWSTPVYVDGSVRDGTLHGNLYIRGEGDPKLVAERLWLMLRRVQGLGIRAIDGDIVLDHSAFETVAADPGAFDGEPLRPYNAAPDALLLNFKSVIMTFTPQGREAALHLEPPLAGVQWPTVVPLTSGPCNDWRGGLKADFSDPSRLRFAGGYPAACGEQAWPLAYVDPPSYAARAMAGLWQQMGGRFTGQVRDGKVPAGLAPAFEMRSAPLGRHRSRHQQVQQQRDGAAVVPDPEPSAKRSGHAGGIPRGHAAVVARPGRHRLHTGLRQRFGLVP